MGWSFEYKASKKYAYSTTNASLENLQNNFLKNGWKIKIQYQHFSNIERNHEDNLEYCFLNSFESSHINFLCVKIKRNDLQ
jgi:ATP sulfurylase